MTDPRPRLGVSACLMGRNVRHDGGQCPDAWVTRTLVNHVDLVEVCPEVAAGFGTPRPTLRLVKDKARDLVVVQETKSGEDRTEQLRAGAAKSLRNLGDLDELDGVILKSKSPSCGVERVKVYDDGNGIPTKSGRGVFAEALLEARPNLPAEEEGRLNDARLRENFVLRIFAAARLRASRGSLRDLMQFHAAHKYLILAHSEAHLRKMGPLLANGKGRDADELYHEYRELLLEALAKPASTRRRQNALHHMAGHLKDGLDASDRKHLHEVIEAYGAGEVPLVVPLTVIRMFQARVDDPYLGQQIALSSEAKVLGLENRI